MRNYSNQHKHQLKYVRVQRSGIDRYNQVPHMTQDTKSGQSLHCALNWAQRSHGFLYASSKRLIRVFSGLTGCLKDILLSPGHDRTNKSTLACQVPKSHELFLYTIYHIQSKLSLFCNEFKTLYNMVLPCPGLCNVSYLTTHVLLN